MTAFSSPISKNRSSMIERCSPLHAAPANRVPVPLLPPRPAISRRKKSRIAAALKWWSVNPRAAPGPTAPARTALPPAGPKNKGILRVTISVQGLTLFSVCRCSSAKDHLKLDGPPNAAIAHAYCRWADRSRESRQPGILDGNMNRQYRLPPDSSGTRRCHEDSSKECSGVCLFSNAGRRRL